MHITLDYNIGVYTEAFQLKKLLFHPQINSFHMHMSLLAAWEKGILLHTVPSCFPAINTIEMSLESTDIEQQNDIHGPYK